ncbi:MAG: hypothetical protein ACI9DF_003297 [Verrucomicrobiales bacterium]|jgi:hypothetical protein
MPKISVQRSIDVASPLTKVYAVIHDFRQWPHWSPWLVTEPECKVTFADDGRQYAWDGKVVGSGNMAISSEDKPQAIHHDLTFIHPWKSQVKVTFALEEKDGGTHVTWAMDSKLPFFQFFLKGMMTSLIGMDYERGLRMLKDYVETGSVPSTLEFPGIQEIKGTSFVGVRTECAIADIGPAMKHDIAKVKAWIDDSNAATSGPPFSIYHHWNVIKGTTDYTFAIPLETIPTFLPSGFISGERASCQAFPIKHTGSYKHLGNAWSAGIFRGRNKIFLQSKTIPPFEVYNSDPETVSDNDHTTTVYFPVR